MSAAKKQELQQDNRIDNWCYLWMAVFMTIGYVIFSVLNYFLGSFVIRCVGGAVILTLVFVLIYSSWKKTINEWRIIYVMMLVSIVIRICYVITTAQKSYSGVEYEIFHNVHTNLTLPEAHQPLYYVACAAIYNTVGLFRFTQPYAIEIVRLITEYLGIVTSISMYYILCELEVNDTAVYLCTSLVAFNPALIILGGQIKPTMLVVALLTLATLFLCRWNNYTDGYNFLLMCIAFGLAVMTDNFSFVYLPVIAVLVIINLVRTIKRRNAINIITTCIQTVAGVVAWVVFSFAYPIRNHSMGINTGLTDLLRDLGSHSGNVNMNERFFSFSTAELLDVFADSDRSRNAWACLLKTSIFGPRASENAVLDISVFRIFVLLGAAVAVSALTMTICNIFTKMDAKKKVNIWTFVGLLAVIIVYYVLENIARPSAQSMEFNVIPIIVIPGFAMLATGMKTMNTKKKLNFVAGVLYVLMVAVCFGFCVSAAAYGLMFLK